MKLIQAGQQSLIPVQATGNYGKEFFKQESPNPRALDLLKKKQRHQELQDKGYIIHQKEKQEIPMDIPMYEVFDPPNMNYRNIFYPQNLNPVVGYNYHSPEFHQNEIFLITQEEQELAEKLMKAAHEQSRLKENKLLKLNQRHEAERLRLEKEQLRKQQEEIMENVVKQKISPPRKRGFQKVGAKGQIIKESEINELLNQTDLNEKKKTVTFAAEDDVNYIPKDWKQSSKDIRARIRQDKKKKSKF